MKAYEHLGHTNDKDRVTSMLRRFSENVHAIIIITKLVAESKSTKSSGLPLSETRAQWTNLSTPTHGKPSPILKLP